MVLAQRVDLAVFRRDPLHFILRVVGADLRAAEMTYAVSLYPDADPATRLLLLGKVSVFGADGIRLVRVDRTPAGQPISILEVLASKTLLAALPRAGEIGDDLVVAHELQITPLPAAPGFVAVETTVFYGHLTIKGSVND